MTMVERVARALLEAHGGHDEFDLDDCRMMARAAIAAMREPTESMTEAARGQMPVQYHYYPDGREIRADIIWPRDKRYVSPVGVYQAAIDAALAETGEQAPPPLRGAD